MARGFSWTKYVDGWMVSWLDMEAHLLQAILHMSLSSAYERHGSGKWKISNGIE